MLFRMSATHVIKVCLVNDSSQSLWVLSTLLAFWIQIKGMPWCVCLNTCLCVLYTLWAVCLSISLIFLWLLLWIMCRCATCWRQRKLFWFCLSRQPYAVWTTDCRRGFPPEVLSLHGDSAQGLVDERLTSPLQFNRIGMHPSTYAAAKNQFEMTSAPTCMETNCLFTVQVSKSLCLVTYRISCAWTNNLKTRK